MDNRPLTTSAILIAAVALAVALKFMAPMMIPFALALLFFYILAPVKTFFHERLDLPHAPSVILALLAGLCVITLFFLMIWTTVDTIGRNQKELSDKLESRIDEHVRGKPVEKVLQSLGLDLGELRASNLLESPRVQRILAASAEQFAGLLVNMVLVLIFLGYLLAGRHKSTSPFLAEVEGTIHRYLLLKVLLAFAAGTLTWLVLAALGLRCALAFGFVAFALNFIPSVGSFLSVLIPVPVAFVDFDLGTRFWLVILLPWALQFTLNNVLEPRIQGEGLDLHPITVLLALMFWGALWGIPGMLIAAPLTSVIRIFLSKTEWGRPAANLLSGRI